MPSKNKTYNRIKLILSLSETAVSFIFICIILFAGYSKQLGDWATGKATNPYLALFLYGSILGIIGWIFTFPLSWYSGYWLEHRYQLSNQTFLKWVREGIKAWLVGLGIAVPLIFVFYFCLLNFPNGWWALVAGVLTLFSVLLARLAPILIFPLFYKFIPIENADLKNKLIQLCTQVNLNVEGIFSFNLSKNTRKANAAFTGIGKSKRIILADTLMQNFTVEEITSVFIHELGHYKYGHMWKGIVVGTVTTFISFWLVHQVYSAFLPALGFLRFDDIGALPMMILTLTGINLLSMPLSNAYSRSHERVADHYALENGSREPFISSMRRLAQQNLTDENPHPFIEWMFHSHPSISKRIQFAETYRTRN